MLQIAFEEDKNMKRNITIIIFLVLFTLFLSSCNFMPSPDSIISSPRPKANIDKTNTNADSIITGFLTKSAKLYIPQKSKNKSPIYNVDLNGDKENELIFVYEDEKHIIQSGFTILKKGKKVWERIFTEKEEFKTITAIDFIDLTGDNLPEILVGYDDMLAIYNYKNNTYKREITLKFTDYKIEDLKNELGTDGMTELLVYHKDIETPEITVLRWSGYKYQVVSDEFPSYNQELIDYYENNKQKYHNQSSYWFSYSQILYNAKKYDQALEYIVDAYFIESHPTKKAQYLIFKAKILLAMGDYEAAIKLVSTEPMQRDNIIKQSKAIIAEAYYMQGDFLLARRIYKDISVFPYEETVQKIDTTLAENNIASYLVGHSKEDPKTLPKKLSEYAEYNDLLITSIIPVNYSTKISNAIVLNYHLQDTEDYYEKRGANDKVISSEDYFIKESVGAHVIFWWEEGKLKKTSFTTIDLYSDHHLNADLIPVAATIKDMENNTTILRVTYKNKASAKNDLPETFNQSFVLSNGVWKFQWK